jgi:hypothetical protein
LRAVPAVVAGKGAKNSFEKARAVTTTTHPNADAGATAARRDEAVTGRRARSRLRGGLLLIGLAVVFVFAPLVQGVSLSAGQSISAEGEGAARADSVAAREVADLARSR